MQHKRYPKHFYIKGVVYFVTTHTLNFRQVFNNSDYAKLLLANLVNYERKLRFILHAHSILPNHVHLLVEPNSQYNISQIMQRIKGYTSKEIGLKRKIKERLWQDRFYDHVIRDENDFFRHLDYIHYNPVKHKLTNKPEDYPFSSYKQYIEKGYYTLGWGHSEPSNVKNLDYEYQAKA